MAVVAQATVMNRACPREQDGVKRHECEGHDPPLQGCSDVFKWKHCYIEVAATAAINTVSVS